MLASGLTPEQYLLREAYCAQIQAQAEAQVAEQRAQLEAIMSRKGDTIKFGRPMEAILAALTEPYKTILVEDGVEYSVPTESIQRGAYDRKRP